MRVDERAVEVLEQARDFRKNVLAEEHHAAARPRRQRRQADDRRIGERDRDVLPRQPQRRPQRRQKIRDVVQSRARRTVAAESVVPRARMMRTPLRVSRDGKRRAGRRRG